jgi:hypothetical protein
MSCNLPGSGWRLVQLRLGSASFPSISRKLFEVFLDLAELLEKILRLELYRCQVRLIFDFGDMTSTAVKGILGEVIMAYHRYHMDCVAQGHRSNELIVELRTLVFDWPLMLP